MSTSSSPPRSPVLSSAEDETLHLALTLLSLPSSISTPRERTAAADPPASPPRASSSSPSSASSQYSWVDLPSMSSDAERSASRAARTDGGRRRPRRSGARAGLSRLSDPPSPFGSQLGVTSKRSTPYHHRHEHYYFDPRPTPRALSVENNRVPRPEPEYVYDTALCALHSAANLARSCALSAAHAITQGGKKSLAEQLAKIGLGVCIVARPRWVLGMMNWSLSVFRDPFRFYHHTFYAWLIGTFLSS